MEAPTKPYPLDNHHPSTTDHHAALTALFDPFSRQYTTGLLKLHGASCLEVGIGQGSFALWLADEIGPDGSVTGIDIKPLNLPEHPQLTVLQHDVIHDPMPGTYDFIHARLVLGHLPQRREVLTKLAGALNPGGVILIEDWWNAAPGDLVVHAPSEEAAELYKTYSQVTAKIFNPTGHDWARRVHAAMMEDGLVDVRTDIHGEAWVGGGPGCRMFQATMGQLRDRLLGYGLTEDILSRVHALLDDPQLVLTGNLMCSTSGRRPV